MEKAQAEDYLHSLLNKTLRVTTDDTRMFMGRFKCTDSDRNIILTQAFEYRFPSPSSTPASPPSEPSEAPEPTSRYLGQVVVPGQHVSKIELDEFASQVRGNASAQAGSSATSTAPTAGSSGAQVV